VVPTSEPVVGVATPLPHEERRAISVTKPALHHRPTLTCYEEVQCYT
jgi:hypothetical protein